MKQNTGIILLSLWVSLISLHAAAQSLSETTRLVGATSSTATSLNTSIRNAASAGVEVSSAAATVSRFNERVLGIVLAALLCSIAFGVLVVILGHIRRQNRKHADRTTLTLTPLTLEGQPPSKILHHSSLTDTGPYETQADRQFSVLYDNSSAIAGLEHGWRAQVSSTYSAHSAVPAPLRVQHASDSPEVRSSSIDGVFASVDSDRSSVRGGRMVQLNANAAQDRAVFLPLVPPRIPRRLEQGEWSGLSHMKAHDDRPSDRRERRQGWPGSDSIANQYGLD